MCVETVEGHILAYHKAVVFVDVISCDIIEETLTFFADFVGKNKSFADFRDCSCKPFCCRNRVGSILNTVCKFRGSRGNKVNFAVICGKGLCHEESERTLHERQKFFAENLVIHNRAVAFVEVEKHVSKVAVFLLVVCFFNKVGA